LRASCAPHRALHSFPTRRSSDLWIGREGGIALVRRYGRVIHLNESHLARAHVFFEKHGPKTVFLGRFIALLRTWAAVLAGAAHIDRKSTRLNSSHGSISYAVFCL